VTNQYPYYAPPPPAPERSNTVWIVLGVIVIVILLCCGGCTALFGLGLIAEPDDESHLDTSSPVTDAATDHTDTTSKPSGSSKPRPSESTTRPSGELGNDTPHTVVEGKRFTHDGFVAAAGWRVVDGSYLGATIEDLWNTHDGGDRRTALLTFRFYDGKTVLAEVECTSNQMQTGESSPMDCISFDSEFPSGYDSIKVSDAF